MKLHLSLAGDFGPQLGDGSQAAEYRMKRIEPFVESCEGIILDFAGVRTANSAFINALVARVVEQHGERVLQTLVFKGCNPVLRVLVEAAIDLGLQKIDARVDA